MKKILITILLFASFSPFAQSDLVKEMEVNAKKQLDVLAKSDAEIVKKVAYQESKDKKAFEEQEADLKKKIKEDEDAINKQIKELEEKSKVVVSDAKPTNKGIDLNKMTEANLLEYGKSIGADVDKKYSKAKNLENIKAKL